MFGKKEDPPVGFGKRMKLFLTVHWRGVIILFVPLLLSPIVLPPAKPYHWCAFTLLVMAIYWVSECIPLPITGFLPIVIFPLTDVMSTEETCACYVNDSVLMFLGSMLLAAAVEQSGLHQRLAYCAIRLIGYSHYKLLFAMCSVTTFVSMWITNTAATTMMVPINFALLKVFEDQKVLKIYEKDSSGEVTASALTACYFCAATFSATIGGIGTLVGTATNLVFKGLLESNYRDKGYTGDYLSFPKFSQFTVPYMIAMEACVYFYLIIVYFGYLRPNSAAAKSAQISDAAKIAAKKTIDDAWKKLGKLTFWEIMVIILFGGAIIGFFCRSPKVITGWADILEKFFGVYSGKAWIRDSAWAQFVVFLMMLLPSSLVFFKNFTAKTVQKMPKGPVRSVLDWNITNNSMPYSFMFLLGGGFALSTAARQSGLNDKIGEFMNVLSSLPNSLVLFLVILVVIFITNFASNVAVCNVFTPISMKLAELLHVNPLWYNITSGLAASYCFMIPVGTPGNLIVQGAAKVSTKQMIVAGFGPTVSTLILTWVFVYFYAPVVWPDLNTFPDWAKKT